MLRSLYSCCTVCCLVVVPSTVAAGQTATFSLEATAVNSVTIPDGSVSRVGALPGDIITLHVQVRDWSDEGEQLYAYQAQVEPKTFASGSLGYIEPLNYAAKQETTDANKAACFIDRMIPEFVHAGIETLAITDSRSEGYRWASILLDEEGPVSPQDGTRFYCGTLKLEVSNNALGTFVIDLMHGPGNSALSNGDGNAIKPINFEPLTIVVRPDIVVLVNGLNGTAGVEDFQVDIDRDGTKGGSDVLKAISMLTGDVQTE